MFIEKLEEILKNKIMEQKRRQKTCINKFIKWAKI